MNKLSIYEYIDYTRYLNDWYDAKKKSNSRFSHKNFAEKLGMKSGSYVTMILNGTRKIPRKQIFSFAQALKLLAKETKYFEAIVMYKESKSFDAKNYYWDIAQNLRPLTQPIILEQKQFEYFNHWYIPVLRELVTYFDFHNDFALLGKQLTPHISKKEAQKGFEILIDLNLIKKTASTTTDGKLTIKKSKTLYELTDTLLVTSSVAKNVAVHNFQKTTIDLAKNALETMGVAERNVQTTTVGTSAQGAFEINKLIEDFQSKILKIAEDNPETERVYHCNIQLYPLTIGEK
jgi:uncharacterized protein (TIGR02147 family)